MSKVKQQIWKDIEGYEGIYQVSNLRISGNICHCVKNRRKTSGGYKWEYYNI